jgi:hypothetical protein
MVAVSVPLSELWRDRRAWKRQRQFYSRSLQTDSYRALSTSNTRAYSRRCRAYTSAAFVERPGSLREQAMAAHKVDWLLLLVSCMNSLQRLIETRTRERAKATMRLKASVCFVQFCDLAKFSSNMCSGVGESKPPRMLRQRHAN